MVITKSIGAAFTILSYIPQVRKLQLQRLNKKFYDSYGKNMSHFYIIVISITIDNLECTDDEIMRSINYMHLARAQRVCLRIQLKYSDELTRYICYALMKMPNLTELSIYSRLAEEFQDKKNTAKNKTAEDVLLVLLKTKIKVLEIDCKAISIKLLAKILPYTSIINLYLYCNTLKDLDELFFTNSLRKIEVLRLKCLKMEYLDQLRYVLKEVGVKDLSINMMFRSIKGSFAHFIKAFPKTSLQRINFSNSSFGDEEAEMLSKILPSSRIIKLNLSNTKITRKGAISLYKTWGSIASQIHSIKLNNNDIGDESIKALSEILPLLLIASKLTPPSLISDRGLTYLEKALPLTTLTNLNLTKCYKLTMNGLRKILKILPSTQITHLGLCIKDNLKQVLSSMPKCVVETLVIHDISKKRQCIIALTKCLKRAKMAKLRTVKLGYFRINNDEAQSLVQAISEGKSKILNIEFRKIKMEEKDVRDKLEELRGRISMSISS